MSALCKGGDGLCTEQAEADGYCDAHHPGPAPTLPSLVSPTADRISQLTAELAETRDERDAQHARAEYLFEDREAERATLERTKAERDRHAGAARHHDQQAQAAYAERDAARRELGEAWKQRDAAQAEAAAMRLAIEPVFDEYIGRGEEPVSMDKAYAVFRDSSAGRTLAARVPLLEAVAKAARAAGKHHKQYPVDYVNPTCCCSVCVAVAALDEKGTT